MSSKHEILFFVDRTLEEAIICSLKEKENFKSSFLNWRSVSMLIVFHISEMCSSLRCL